MSETEELRQRLEQIGGYLAQQLDGLKKDQQSIKRALNIRDDRMPFEPFYNPHVELSDREPELYNKYGERLQPIFLSDRDGAHDPYGGMLRYVFLDRYDYGLKNHIYTHDEAFRTVGKPVNKFAWLMEARVVKPQPYENFLRNKAYVESEFKYVFTFDAELLNKLSNARLFLNAGFWYGGLQSKMADGEADPKYKDLYRDADNWKNKTKNISIIASNKRMVRMHLVRQAFAQKCKAEHLADTFGRFDGGPYVPIELPFQHYRYSIAIENEITPYYFTEKITNCFASMTIPIYLGAPKVDQFFNPDGIITLKESDYHHLGEFLKQCTPEEYERRLPAVIDNYNRIMSMQDGNSGLDLCYKQFMRPLIEST